MKLRSAPIFVVLTLALLAPHVMAEEAVTGELHINTNSDYAKVTVNGAEWESVEYERSGKRILVKGLEFEVDPIVVVVTPGYDNLGPVTLKVPHKDFKRKVIKRVAYMIAKRKVKFPKVKTKTPAPKPQEPEPDKKPSVDPGEQEDDL